MVDLSLVTCLTIIATLLSRVTGTDEIQDGALQSSSRQSRALLFPGNTGIGILFAVAVPIDLPEMNCFYSYNFEANYILPTTASDIFPGPLERFDLVDSIGLGEDGSRNLNCKSNSTCEPSAKQNKTSKKSKKKKKKKKKKKRKHRKKHEVQSAPLFTRRTVYKALIDKFKLFGYNGRECLLRIICEVNAFSLAEHNGVVGSIFHIIFSPSTSTDEGIADVFYEAEIDGTNENCEKYTEHCEESVLDLIIQEFEDV